jgi:hypothetical protein
MIYFMIYLSWILFIFWLKKNKDLLLYILERIEKKKKKRKGRGNDKKGSGEGTPLLSDRNAFKVSVLT